MKTIIVTISLFILAGFIFWFSFGSDSNNVIEIINDDLGTDIEDDDQIIDASTEPDDMISDIMQTETASFSLTGISTHNQKTDCWLAVSDKVYDVTDFINSHPGGEAILEGCGQDATTLFETRPMGSGTPHSDNARNLLPSYFIGNLIK